MKPAAFKEILIYALVAASSLFLMTYVVHMMVGGLVSPQTELGLTIALCALVACLIGAMAWDVVRRRRSAKQASNETRADEPRANG
jgi:hypothetical protein